MGLFDWWKNRSRASGRTSLDEAARSFGFYPELQLSNEPGWLPETVDGDGPPRGSRIGGHAFLLAGEAHPACGVCGAPLHLVVQLNSGELPEPMSAWTGPGTFQVFCCLSDCSAEADGRAPSSRVHLTRRIDLYAAGELASVGRSASARAITGWHPIDDVPLWRETPLEITEEMEEHYEFSEGPFEGDKLGGWPTWVHGPEYQHCKRCGAKMRVLFQVGSHFNLDWMWGDTGCAYLSVCGEHTDQLAFSWASL